MKLDDQLVLELRCELEEIVTEREGMIAENQQRSFLGQSTAFTDNDFDLVRNKIKALRERIVRFGEKPDKP